MSDYLEEGVLINILRRLPIKTLVQCTAVCKSWYVLITSPFFISTHLKSRKDHLLVRYCYDDRPGESNTPFELMKKNENYCLVTDDNSLDKYSEFEIPFNSIGWCYRIVGCCNGLICLSEDMGSYHGVIILWNPCVRKSVLLPEPILHFKPDNTSGLALGFGFDSVKNDYKVVRITHFGDGAELSRAEVYALNMNTWRDISHLMLPYCVECRVSAYFEGAVHWFARHKEKDKVHILAFDMSKEVFSELQLPDNMVNDKWAIAAVLVYKESLAVTTYDRFGGNPNWVVWVMEDYGNPKSWTKLFGINYFEGFQRILGFTKSCQVLFLTHDGYLVSCDPKSLQVKYLGIQGYVRGYYVYAFYASTYVESLVFLDRRADFCYANTLKVLRKKTPYQIDLEV